MKAGYVQLRRGLREHVADGKMTVMEFGVYGLLLMDADPATGICRASAGGLAALYGVTQRTARDLLEKLEQKHYLKRFPTQGKHGSYPILMHKFLCSDGAMKGKRLNALSTETCEQPVYEACHDSVNDGVNESAAYGEQRKEKRDNNSFRAKQASADERFSDFREDFGKYFRHKCKVEAPWDGREAKSLSRWLKANPQITRIQWRDILQHRGNSPVAHGEPLSVWIARALNWLPGPADTWGKPITGGMNGTRNSNPAQARTDANRAAAEAAIERMYGSAEGFGGDEGGGDQY